MPDPDGSLTPAQFEILQLLWDSPGGLSVAEIWEAVRGDRDVSRTTVLNLVDRLEKRNWLTREKIEGVFRYSAAMDRRTTESQLAESFVGEFFDGSPSSFVLSLLGSGRISKAELRRLRELLNDP
ncbi:MAG: BlaI/MecI/CopY family transcriptional regulator [Planctomycetaceae bacterium]